MKKKMDFWLEKLVSPHSQCSLFTIRRDQNRWEKWDFSPFLRSIYADGSVLMIDRLLWRKANHFLRSDLTKYCTKEWRRQRRRRRIISLHNNVKVASYKMQFEILLILAWTNTAGRTQRINELKPDDRVLSPFNYHTSDDLSWIFCCLGLEIENKKRFSRWK